MFDSKRLRQRRLDMGLTQEEVGKKVGLSKSGVQKHEKGIIKNVYTSTLEDFANALHCSPAYLMGWIDIPNQGENIHNLTDEQAELIKMWNNTQQEGQKAALAILREFQRPQSESAGA